MNIQVSKNDGSTEAYQPDKLVRVALAAGLDNDQALTLATHIYDWIIANPTRPIPTAQIRDKMVEELGAVSKYAHDLYIWYENTKSTSQSQSPHPTDHPQPVLPPR